MTVTTGGKMNAETGEVNGEIAAKKGPKTSGTSAGVTAVNPKTGLKVRS
jgi:hypothetical protein